MAFNVNIEVDKTLIFNAPAEEVFELLANVPESAGFFPKLQSLNKIENNTYQWLIEEIGHGGHSFQPAYTCEYKIDKENGIISWAPVWSKDNTAIKGSWVIDENEGVSSVRFQSSIVVNLPFSKLIKVIVQAIVKQKFDQILEQYLDNLQSNFSNEQVPLVVLG